MLNPRLFLGFILVAPPPPWILRAHGQGTVRGAKSKVVFGVHFSCPPPPPPPDSQGPWTRNSEGCQTNIVVLGFILVAYPPRFSGPMDIVHPVHQLARPLHLAKTRFTCRYIQSKGRCQIPDRDLKNRSNSFPYIFCIST